MQKPSDTGMPPEEIIVPPPTETFNEERLTQLKARANAQYTKLANTLKEMEDVVAAFEADSRGFVLTSKEYGTTMREIYEENIKTKL